jgi:hypothetical protein
MGLPHWAHKIKETKKTRYEAPRLLFYAIKLALGLLPSIDLSSNQTIQLYQIIEKTISLNRFFSLRSKILGINKKKKSQSCYLSIIYHNKGEAT